jgi:hypothetical protein
MINFEELFCPECTCPMSIENPGTCQNCDYQTEAYHLEHDQHEVPDFTPAEAQLVHDARDLVNFEREVMEDIFISALKNVHTRRLEQALGLARAAETAPPKPRGLHRIGDK